MIVPPLELRRPGPEQVSSENQQDSRPQQETDITSHGPVTFSSHPQSPIPGSEPTESRATVAVNEVCPDEEETQSLANTSAAESTLTAPDSSEGPELDEFMEQLDAANHREETETAEQRALSKS